MKCLIIEQIEQETMSNKQQQKQQTAVYRSNRQQIPLDSRTSKQYNPH